MKRCSRSALTTIEFEAYSLEDKGSGGAERKQLSPAELNRVQIYCWMSSARPFVVFPFSVVCCLHINGIESRRAAGGKKFRRDTGRIKDDDDFRSQHVLKETRRELKEN